MTGVSASALASFFGLAPAAGTVRARMAEYANAGVDEVALVPGSSDADPAGVATLTAMAP